MRSRGAALVALALALALAAAALLSTCSRERPEPERAVPNAVQDSASAIWHVQEFERLVKAGQTEIARAFMAPNPRRWYETRSGDGEPWDVAQGAGRWAAWDREFHSRTEDVHWTGHRRAVTRRMRETNDYYRLLDRPPGETDLVYYLNENGRIEGSLVRAAGRRERGREDDFLAWVRSDAPGEIDYLRPDGKIDPTGDRPLRTRRLLERWRAAAGLPPVR